MVTLSVMVRRPTTWSMSMVSRMPETGTARPRQLLFVLVAMLLIAGCNGANMPNSVAEVVLPDSVSGRITVAVDPTSGEAFVAYPVEQDGRTDVYLARLDDQGSTVGSPVRVNDKPGDAAVHQQAPAQVAVGPDGSINVVWIAQKRIEGRRFPASDLRYARSVDGGKTFSPALTVNPDPGVPSSHHFHNMTVAPDGTIYVAWLDGSARDLQRSAAGHHQNGHQHEAMAHHHGGDDGGPGTELRVARSVDGGRTFEAPVVVARNTCQCCRTALAVDDDGKVYVAWRHLFGGTERDIALAMSSDGGLAFSEPVRVYADHWDIDGCPHAGPALAVGSDGVIHVAWYTGAGDRVGVYYASSADGGGSFSKPIALVSGIPVAQVALAVNGHHATVAYDLPLEHELAIWTIDSHRSDEPATQRVPGLLPSIAAFADEMILVRTHDDRALLMRGL